VKYFVICSINVETSQLTVVSWTTYWFFSSWIAVALIFSQLALGGMWGTANKFRVTSLPENFRGQEYHVLWRYSTLIVFTRLHLACHHCPYHFDAHVNKVCEGLTEMSCLFKLFKLSFFEESLPSYCSTFWMRTFMSAI